MIKKILLLVFLFTSLSIFGQTPVFEWALRQGGTSGAAGRSISIDSFGSVYITGDFNETGDFDPDPSNSFPLVSNGSFDIFISKFSADGQLLWAHSFGDTLGDRGRGVATDLTGNVYVTGTFLGTIDFDPGPDTFNLTSSEGHNFMLKLDTNGDFVWAKVIGQHTFRAGNIVVDEGYIYTTGIYSNISDFDPSTSVYNLSSNGDHDVFILKLDTTGSFIWAKSVGGGNRDISDEIAIDNENNVYVTGYFEGTADFDPGADTYNLTPSGDYDQFILKLNSEGFFVWVKK